MKTWHIILATIIFSVVCFVPWWQYRILNRAEELVHIKYEQILRQNITLHERIDVLEQAICHEINMRTNKPAERLSAKQCIEFIELLAKDARAEKDPGKGLSVTLTPSPTACPNFDQYCQIIREKR